MHDTVLYFTGLLWHSTIYSRKNRCVPLWPIFYLYLLALWQLRQFNGATMINGWSCNHDESLHMSKSWWYDDVIKWKHFPRYWSFVRGIHRYPVNSPHKDQWRGALMFSLICAWIKAWVNNREAGDLRRHRIHYGVIITIFQIWTETTNKPYAHHRVYFVYEYIPGDTPLGFLSTSKTIGNVS